MMADNGAETILQILLGCFLRQVSVGLGNGYFFFR